MKRNEDFIFHMREEFPCPYIQDGRTASIEYLLPSEADTKHFHEYLSRGYRRLDTVFYHNCCTDCSSCMPIRLIAKDFTPARSQKRTLRENDDIDLIILQTPAVTDLKVRLYEKYLQTKHGKTGGKKGCDPETVLRMLHCGCNHALEMDYYLGETLIGVGIVDEGRNALSSNYFYYDTDFLSRRLGIFSIMQEIFLAQRMKKRYYYLGFYIEETAKMSYKKYFRPNQILRNGEWMNFLNSPSGAKSACAKAR
jgi:arginine-tRNA-protein transferase